MTKRFDNNSLQRAATKSAHRAFDVGSYHVREPRNGTDDALDAMWQDAIDYAGTKFAGDVPAPPPAHTIIARAQQGPVRKRVHWPMFLMPGIGAAVLAAVFIVFQFVPNLSQYIPEIVEQHEFIPESPKKVKFGESLVFRGVKGNFKLVQKEDKAGTKVELKTNNLAGVFELNESIDLVLEHPKVRIKVVGTVFSVDLKKRKGRVTVTKGAVDVYNKFSDETVRVTAGNSYRFSKKKAAGVLKPIKKKKPTKKKKLKSDTYVLEKIELSNSDILVGVILAETKKKLLIITDEKEKRWLLKKNIKGRNPLFSVPKK